MAVLFARASITAALAFAMVGIAHPGATGALRAHSAARAGFVPRHLYVADTGADAILRYPLSGGLPRKAPDEVFAPISGMAYPAYLAVDRVGNIYIAASSLDHRQSLIRVYNGNGRLLSVAQLPSEIMAFTVDGEGYMYAVTNASPKQIDVFAPGQAMAPILRPVAVLHGVLIGGFGSMTLDREGRLYGESLSSTNVFDHPHLSSTPSSTILPPPLHWLGCPAWFGGAQAFDGRGRLYANITWQCHCRPQCNGGQQWHDTDFDAISQWRSRMRADDMIYAKNCFLSEPRLNPGKVTGMAVFGGYIDAACYGDAPKVVVYHAQEFSHQRAVEILDGTSLPSDAKIGP